MLTIPPQVKIQLNLGTDSEPHYRDVNHLSDGQRCTAILGILMLESPYPLIVDQPEEDLDNAFIVEEIAERFRSQMDKRQFLAATHNANIPVLGDASQILALEADVGHSYLKEGRYGYLDSPEIKHTVESILEGGRQAFIIRKEKYGL
jgi:ABC-type cobalamin/Fe3+-siderophores transport system ATPase subunit